MGRRCCSGADKVPLSIHMPGVLDTSDEFPCCRDMDSKAGGGLPECVSGGVRGQQIPKVLSDERQGFTRIKIRL